MASSRVNVLVWAACALATVACAACSDVVDAPTDDGGVDAGNDCANDNTPGSRCIDPIRFDFDLAEGAEALEANLERVGAEMNEPEDGFQITTQGIRMAPSDDDEFCEAFEVPMDPENPDRDYCITHFEVAMTPGYHHLFVSKAPIGSPSEKLMKVGERTRCVGGAHVTYGTDLLPIPLPQGDYVDVPYYPGIGERLKPGQKISVNYHYLNTSDDDQLAVTKLNFHAAPCDGLIEMGQFGFYNQDIEIPAGGTAATTMSATFTQDVYVYDLFRHTHRFGRDVPISYYKGAHDGELIFNSTDYEQGAGFRFPEPVLIKKGEGFSFVCNFENDTDKPIRFGPTADDEMCMLLGTFWAANGEPPMTQHRYKWGE